MPEPSITLLRPVLELEHGVQPHGTVRVARDRLGLGDEAERGPVMPELVPTWSRLYVLDLSVAAAATEQIASELIQQPFMVSELSIQHHAAVAADVDISLAFGQDAPAAGSTGDATRRPINAATSETAAGQLTHADTQAGGLAVGTIVRNVPGRLVLTSFNNTAGAVRVTATATLVFLTPRHPRPRPCGCGGYTGP